MPVDEVTRGLTALAVALIAGGGAIWATIRFVVKLERTSVADLMADRARDRDTIMGLRADVDRAEAKADQAALEADAVRATAAADRARCAREILELQQKNAEMEAQIATLRINIRELGGPAL